MSVNGDENLFPTFDVWQGDNVNAGSALFLGRSVAISFREACRHVLCKYDNWLKRFDADKKTWDGHPLFTSEQEARASGVRTDGVKAMQDTKYRFEDGRIVNRATGIPIPENEPVFVFRAKDCNAVLMLQKYAAICINPEQKAVVMERVRDFLAFADGTPGRVKEPDTARTPEMEPSTILPGGTVQGYEVSDATFRAVHRGELKTWEEVQNDRPNIADYNITAEGAIRGEMKHVEITPELLVQGSGGIVDYDKASKHTLAVEDNSSLLFTDARNDVVDSGRRDGFVNYSRAIPGEDGINKHVETRASIPDHLSPPPVQYSSWPIWNVWAADFKNATVRQLGQFQSDTFENAKKAAQKFSPFDASYISDEAMFPNEAEAKQFFYNALKGDSQC